MKKEDSQFYLVDLQILPEAIKKAIKVKEMLKDGTCGNINEAVQKVKMSRSAYYKYKDHVAPAFDAEQDRIVVLFVIMSDDFPVFNKVMRRIGKDKNTILSFNRTAASSKTVAVTITLKTEESLVNLQYMKEALGAMKGVQSVTFGAGGDL
ncbi:MAG TPA: amino acid-binding protein [Dialister sp.]|nr:amino acid-binding protein [Dialister sp.]